MEKKETGNILVNRIVSFLAGGLLVFIVMSVTVVSSAKNENKTLSASLDLSRFEAGRLLADAKAEYASRNYDKAKESLTSLSVNQPGSAEALEGKSILVNIETAEKAANVKWDAASAAVQKKWFDNRATELRADSDKERAKLEAGLKDQINQEWEKAKDAVRTDWEKTS